MRLVYLVIAVYVGMLIVVEVLKYLMGGDA